MKEIKTTKTIEEVTGYEAFDGTLFRTVEACKEYEDSAKGAAKQAAWHYLVDDRGSYDLFGCEESGLLVFDVPNADAYTIIRHWAELGKVWDAKGFTPDYIGKRVGFYTSWEECSFIKCYATKEAMLAFYTREIEKMFADKDAPAEPTT